MTPKKIAIIGFGRFGQLLTQLLIEHTDSTITVISRKPPSLQHPRISWGTYQELETVEVVIPTVPISNLAEILLTIKPFLSRDALVLDVCSVKIQPIAWMLEHLPPEVNIIGTHPMFGPDSVKSNQGTAGLKIIVCPVRTNQLHQTWLKELCQKMKLEIIELTPEEHDRHAAFSLAYFSLIGKIGQEIGISSTPIDTPWFSKLLELKSVVEHDSEQLFLDMQRYNPYAAEMRAAVLIALTKLNQLIELPLPTHE